MIRDGLKRKNAKRLEKVAIDGNRRLLACPVRQARDGRRALRLEGDARLNLLTRALADDSHFGPYMAIPGKDNGFDIEGLAVDGRRLLLGLRGPVRFESALTESVSLPHGNGTNRAEVIGDLPPALSGGKASWLVLYDTPGADRREGEHTVFGDLLRHD